AEGIDGGGDEVVEGADVAGVVELHTGRLTAVRVMAERAFPGAVAGRQTVVEHNVDDTAAAAHVEPGDHAADHFDAHHLARLDALQGGADVVGFAGQALAVDEYQVAGIAEAALVVSAAVQHALQAGDALELVARRHHVVARE